MIQFAKNFIRDERGEDLMEYGLLVAFVAAVASAVIISDPVGLKQSVIDAFTKAKDALDSGNSK